MTDAPRPAKTTRDPSASIPLGDKKQELIYLDNAATAFPKPPMVLDAMLEFYREHGVSPGRSGYDMCLAAEEMVHATRASLTELFGGTHPDRLTFSYNGSDSLNMILQGMLARGDHVITTNLEHNSVLRPLHHLERDGGVEITLVPFDERGFVDPDDIERAIKSNTKLVVVNHGSNVIGTLQAVGEMGKICRKRGVFFAVDASQTAGVERIDVQEMSIDLLAFTGHKSLMGPTGIGGSYVGEGVPIRATRAGGTGVQSANPYHLEEFPYRLEVGTLNIIGVAGLLAGQRWIEEQGIESIKSRELRLWDRLRLGIEQIPGVTTHCAGGPADHIAVLSFNVDGIEASDVGTMLDVDHGIACRTGLHCAPMVHKQLGTDRLKGTVRMSIGPFNTEAHIDRAIEAVAEIAETRRK
ncbi:MAG: aminotransferase class V-fold PLP-dependent enzyme [Polyangia bacterium]|mgnify:CR=1 FL=1|jgi:cysteine desulfurase family protein|nr:aminotransferase class V-fold PLP-dependent enzyme [Polyangia bacterium]